MLTYSVLVTLLIILALLLTAFAIIDVVLAQKIKVLRLALSQLLEEKAKITQDADKFAQLAQNPLGPLFERNSQPLILSFNAKGKITSVNDTLLETFGYLKNTLVGKNVIGTILPKPEKHTDNIVTRLFANPNLFIDTETKVCTKNKREIWISWTNNMVYDDKGNPLNVHAVGFDITKRKQMEAELQYLSSIDPQTGVMNRHALLDTGATELKRAKRYGRTLSVAVIKFQTSDSTRSLSDTQLKSVTQLMRSVIRSVDYIGRLADVDFALVLPETDHKNVPFLMQRLNQQLSEYNKKNNTQVTLIYGAVSYTKKADTIDNLISKAWKQVTSKTSIKTKKVKK